LIDQLFNSSENGSRAFFFCRRISENGKPTPIDASISQATLAEMIGTTRPRVSFFLKADRAALKMRFPLYIRERTSTDGAAISGRWECQFGTGVSDPQTIELPAHDHNLA
jgi:hypothetical protein